MYVSAMPTTKKHPLEGEWVQEKNPEIPPIWADKAADGAGVGLCLIE